MSYRIFLRKSPLFCLLMSMGCQPSAGIEGTWQLVSATTTENGQSRRDDLSGKQMIKILNKSHFSFLNHDMNGGKDSLAFFGAGGGTYTLEGDQYTEHLDYCSDRAWEKKNFSFTVRIEADSLIQTGKEEVKERGINRVIVEKYVRVKG